MALTPAQWETATSLFEAALECEAGVRSAFVREKCDDCEVRQEVERLLVHYAEMGSFLKEAEPSDTGSPTTHAIVPTFSDCDTLAGRFRITRFIAHGGMGEVYEAEDLELHESVAIKTIRSNLVSPSFLDRFKKEVQLAKKVTHPNVCRVYDLFRHKNPAQPTEGGNQDIFFISMELLAGETLAERLRRSGRMTSAEALPIIEQIADALEGAHAVGVLHRDLKPENVMLVSSPPQGSVRAVVTDFGLALRTVTFGLDHGEIFEGTPVYMSPEQMQGRELSPASDVYSFGLVMYRMLTGVRAFEHEDPTLFGSKRLSADPKLPRQLVPGLDRRWETAILKCLEREPTRRTQKPSQALEALTGEKIGLIPNLGVITFSAVAAALFLVLIVLGLRWYSGLLGEKLDSHSRVAVVGFKNTSARPGDAWISDALSIFLTAKLSVGDKLETVPEDEIARIKTDLSLRDSDSLARGTLAQIRSGLGADLVVFGSYRTERGQVRFNLRIVNSAAGVSIGSVEEIGSSAALLDVFTRAGNGLRAMLKLPQATRQAEDEALASLPSNLDSFRLYTDGIRKLRQFDALSARDQLEQAVRADPGYPLAHSGLAEAWSALGYDEKAATAANAAFDLSGRLSWRDRQLIEGRYREMSKQWDLAAEIYRRLWTAYPREVDYGLRLASVQTSAGNTDKALATAERLRTALTTGRDDPRIDYAEALAQDNIRAKQFAAARAAEKAAAAGQRQLLAAARRDESRSLLLMGRRKEALEALNQARSIYASLGDRAHVAYVSLNLASALNGQASVSARRAMIEESLQAFRSVGCKEGEGAALNNLAGVLEDTGDLNQALKTYQQAMNVYGQIGNRYRMVNTLNNIGTVLQTQGDLAGALKEYVQSLTLWKTLNNRDSATFVRWNIADVLCAMGRLKDSSRMYDEILAVERQSGTETGVGGALHGKGDVLMAQGRLALARRAYEQAEVITRKLGSIPSILTLLHKRATLEIYKGNFPEAHRLIQEARQMRQRASQVGEQNDIGASNRVVEARLRLEEGRPEDAEPLARSATLQFHEHHNVPEEMIGRIVLARSLLARSKMAESQIELNQVTAFLRRSPIELIRLDYLIASARTKAASGTVTDISEARRTLQTALDESQAQGFVGKNLEARLAEAEIELKVGDSGARNTLATLEKEATMNGFGLIAQQAGRLTLNPLQ